MKLWYAVLFDNYDTDWGYGSRSRTKALEMLRGIREIHPDAYIAVIADGDDPVCIEEFRP